MVPSAALSSTVAGVGLNPVMMPPVQVAPQMMNVNGHMVATAARPILAPVPAEPALPTAHRTADAQKPVVDKLDEYNPELTGVAGAIDSGISKGFMADMIVTMGAPVVGGVAGALNYVGKVPYAGVPFRWAGTAVNKVKDVVSAPFEFAKKTDVGDALSKGAEGTRSVVGYFSKDTAAKMDGFVEGAAKAETKIGATVEKGFQAASDRVGGVIESSPTLKGMFEAAAKNRSAAFDAAHSQFLGAGRDVSLTGVRGWMNARKNPDLLKTMADAMKDLEAQKVHATPQDIMHIDAFKATYDQLHAHLGDAANIKDVAKSEALLKQATKASESLAELSGGAHPQLQGSLANVTKTFGKMVEAGEKLTSRAATVSFVSDPAAALAKGKDALARMNLHHGAMNVGMMGMSIFGIARTSVSMEHDLEALKKLVAASEGVKPSEVSTMHAVFGDAKSPMVEHAQKYFTKLYAAEGAIALADIGLNVAMMRKNGISAGVGVGGLMALGAGSMFLREENELTAFDGLSRAFDSGAQVGAGAYAQFIKASVPEAKNIPLENPLMQAMAQHYAQLQMRPEQLVQEIQSGKMTQTASQLQHQMAAERQAQEAAEAANTPHLTDNAKGEFVKAGAVASSMMSATKDHPKEKEVLGAHTARAVGASVPRAAAHSSMAHVAHQALTTSEHARPHVRVSAMEHEGALQHNEHAIG